MQTLFQSESSWSDRFWERVRRHKFTSAFIALSFLLLLALADGYQKFSSAQTPDDDFDAGVGQPAYTDTHPKVLFDAAHYNFHTAEGNYRPFVKLLHNDGYVVISNHEKFRAESLKPYRVLVIGNALGGKGVLAMLLNLLGYQKALQWPMSAFTPAECDAVRDWVARGGSLLLISDHAPTGNAARELSQRFGVDMSNWFTEDDQHSDPDAYGWLVFSRENGLLLPHPVTEGRGPAERINKVLTFTGQSLSAPEGAVPFLNLAPTSREYPGRDSTLAEGRSAAGRAQGVALTYGRGRVVVLGEAAMLSAQVFRIPGRELRLGMDYPGCDNRQLALNITHWLSGLTN